MISSPYTKEAAKFESGSRTLHNNLLETISPIFPMYIFNYICRSTKEIGCDHQSQSVQVFESFQYQVESHPSMDNDEALST